MELASYDPFLSSGMNLSFAGTHLNSGRSLNGSACVVGFDQAGFIMGSSASLFNVRTTHIMTDETDDLSSSKSSILGPALYHNSRAVIAPASYIFYRANSEKFAPGQTMSRIGRTLSKGNLQGAFKTPMLRGLISSTVLLIKKTLHMGLCWSIQET